MLVPKISEFPCVKSCPAVIFFPVYLGTTCIGITTPSFSEATRIFEIVLKSSSPVPPSSKTPGPALLNWMEVQHHPGLVCAVSKTTSNPVTLLIKPETIQVHELKALPNKAKVQGMVAMRQPPSTGELVSGCGEWMLGMETAAHSHWWVWLEMK